MRKYNGSYTIPIKKHTKVRRPKSKWKLWVFPYQPILNKVEGVNYVQDISIGLEDPLDTTYTQPLNVWNEWGEWTPEMVKMIDNIKLPKNSDITFFSPPKPKSLWQKLTNKLRRK